MKNDNLIKYNKNTPKAEKSNNSRKGGIKSGETKRERKKLYEIYREQFTEEEAINNYHMLQEKAKQGDIKALEIMYEVISEFAPKDPVKVDANITYEKILNDLQGDEF